MIVLPRVGSIKVKTSRVLVPVISDFVVVQDMDPWKFVRDGWPIWGCIDPSVLTSKGLHVLTKTLRHIGIDEIAKEDHKVGFEFRYPVCEVLEPREM